MSNLQRQILHSEQTVGMPKTVSAAQAIQRCIHSTPELLIYRFRFRINSRVQVDVMTEALGPSNAISLLSQYDLILDCTDNAPTRYLLSDIAVFLKKPLVSGAAQKYDGQLCTYNLGTEGPCYRCLFPKPPAVETTGTCEETGILGVVTGIIGNLQAAEAIKIIAGLNGIRLILKKLFDRPAYIFQTRNHRFYCILLLVLLNSGLSNFGNANQPVQPVGRMANRLTISRTPTMSNFVVGGPQTGKLEAWLKVTPTTEYMSRCEPCYLGPLAWLSYMPPTRTSKAYWTWKMELKLSMSDHEQNLAYADSLDPPVLYISLLKLATCSDIQPRCAAQRPGGQSYNLFGRCS
jgi:molybdopterin/thiamine biosynthesis adenylyltransferase